MKATIVVQAEPFYLAKALEEIFNQRARDIACVIELENASYNLKNYLYHISAFGLKALLVTTGRFLKVKFLTIVNFLGFSKQAISVVGVCRAYAIPFYAFSDINAENSLKIIEQARPDLIISFSSGQKFCEQLLNLPKSGCINVHSGPLPKYRGQYPNFWALKNAEKKTAVTIHYMDKSLDSGDILLEKEVDILPEDTLDSLIAKTKKSAASLIVEIIDAFEKGKPSRRNNPRGQGVYYSLPGRQDILDFRKSGKRFI